MAFGSTERLHTKAGGHGTDYQGEWQRCSLGGGSEKRNGLWETVWGGIADCGIRRKVSAQRHTTCSAEERKGASSGPSGSCERGT